MPPYKISDRSLGGLRSAVTRALTSAKEIMNLNNPSLANLNSNLETLLERWGNYFEAWQKFRDEREELSDEEYEEIQNKHAEFEESFFKERNRLNQFLSESQNENSKSSVPTQDSVKARLPEVRLNTFDGSFEEWQSWFDSFRSLVHERQDIDKVVKMTHLKSCVTGKAYAVIAGFQITETDYDNAVAALQERFANPDKVRESLVLQFTELAKPKNRHKELEMFKLDFERILKTLKHYVEGIEGAYWFISLVLKNKLPSEVVMFLYQKYDVKYFTIEQISAGLADHLEFLDGMPNSVKSTPDSSQVRDKVKIPSLTRQASIDHTQIGTYAIESSSFKYKCLLCSLDSHRARSCPNYPDAAARRSRLLDMRRCCRCLKYRHEGRCPQPVKCYVCNKGNHNEIFCYSNFGSNLHSNRNQDNTSKSSKSVNSVTVEVDSLVSSTQTMGQNSSSVLATAQVKVSNQDNSQSAVVRCFFDPGSQLSFITAGLAKKLELKVVERKEMTLQGFQSQPKDGIFELVRPLVSLGKRVKKMEAVVIDKLPNSISAPGMLELYERLQAKGVRLADKVTADTVSDIEIMIGVDYFSEFIGGIVKYEGVSLFETPGGSIPFGRIPLQFSNDSGNSIKTNFMVCRLTANVSPLHISDLVEESNEPVHKLWELESLGINPTAASIEDDCVYRKYVNSVEYQNGQYFVRLPWKENCPILPNNYRIALGQVYSLRRNLDKVPGHLEAYHSIIQEQLEANFIEKVLEPRVGPDTHYIPHHGVLKDSDTTPLRIVYNCSARDGKDSPSLNDCLIKGPSLTEKLGDVLLKFRVNESAFCADISKAFLRVGLQSADRDYTRFLWFRDPQNPEAGLDTYRFASVLFGSTSSPFLLMATLDYHLSRSDSPFKDLIARSFYVDNLQGTMSNETELLEFYQEANNQLNSANMPLRSWITNNEKLKARIEEDNIGYKVPNITSVLGLVWNVSLDILSLKAAKLGVPDVLNKRNLLSLVSSVFDPLGLLCPIIIKGKLLIQAAWRANVSWSDPLGEEFLEKWRKLSEEFNSISELSVPRKVAIEGESYNLHVFCDSSTKAYGCAAYLVGNGESNLVMAKAKVAPLKTKTLPQLELTSIWLGTKLATYIHEVLGNINILRTVIWSDNEAAIQWVRNDNSKIVYVKNRVAEIREHAVNYQIFHVPTGENPADLVTRGVEVKDLTSRSLWFKGPPWLPVENSWPCQKQDIVVYGITVERETVQTNIESLFNAKDHSSLERIFRVTDNVFQFVRNLLSRKFPNRMIKKSLPDPAVYWLRYYQLTKYKETFTWLFYSEDRDRNEFQFLYNLLPKPRNLSVECSDLIKDLGLYFDTNVGLIKSRGRLQHAEIAASSKCPVLVPPGEHLTNLFIRKAHRYNLHGGVQETLATIRQQFWIPKGRQAVRKVIRKCIICRKVEGRTCIYPGPPSLPLHRVVLNRPFENVGVDYSGPIVITKTEDNEPRKVYICLFTCTATRAVHLDVALDMTAESFLGILRRFCSTWSVPKQIISDNGSNFKATAKFLEEMSNETNIREYVSNRGIVWKFIAPRAPWQGGFYERLIKIVKNCLRKVLYRKRVSLDELQTVVVEMQARINNRPLTYINSDRMSPEPLCPSHLLYGRSIEVMPPVVLEEESDPTYMDHSQLNKQFSLVSRMIRKFEKVWKNEYIVSLRERHYGSERAKDLNNLKVGDVVLIQAEAPRSEWPLGKIVELRPDSEGVIRSVDVYCKGHINTRTVEKLIPLEVSESIDEETTNIVNDDVHIDISGSDVPTPLVKGTRPQRASKTRATIERRELINQGAL